MNAQLTIVIVNYNTRAVTAQCLESLQQHVLKSDLAPKVIVVDNASHDDSVAHIRHHFKWVELIESPKNLGFAGGNNLALKHITTPYVMLLNSDTELTNETKLPLLIEHLENHPHDAVVTPKILLSSGKLDKACHRGEPTPWRSLCHFTGLAKLFPRVPLFASYHLTYLDLKTPHHVEACSGAAMIVRTSAIKEVGLLDERFFMYAEDLDWCRRLREAGYGIFYHPESTLIHHKYQSGKQNIQRDTVRASTFYFYATMLQYYAKYYPQPWHRVLQYLAYLGMKNYYQQEIDYVLTPSLAIKN
jgi:N-acetylglucosaminyl-diphospho-decaprenol L-rhamnosyltransferase